MSDDGVVEPSAEGGLPEEDALDQLNARRRVSQARTQVDGHSVAQLASKYPGLVSPLETSPSGDHKFSAAEIFDEHEKLRDRFGDSVILLLSTDYGKRQKVKGKALWVTFYDGNFSGVAAVKAWCRRSFPEFSGSDLENACTARTLRPGR